MHGLRLKTLAINDINYYVNRFLLYIDIMQKIYKESGFYNRINNVSKFIKSIGGSGHIHGGIVDIDFLNHVWVDPKTLCTVWYYAESTSKFSRVVYKNPLVLLKRIEYIKLIDNLPVFISDETPQEVYDNAYENMYKISNAILIIQSLIRDGILKEWNEYIDKLINHFYGKHINGSKDVIIENIN